MKVKITKLQENAYSLKRKFLFWWIDDGAPLYKSFSDAEEGALNIYKVTNCETEILKEKK